MAIIALALGYLLLANNFRSQFTPAPGVKTYSQLKAQGLPLQRAVRIANPANHYCVFADVTPLMWTLPSGPPAYLFDEFGQLVDFTDDVGDSTEFQEDYKVFSGTEVDIETIEELFLKRKAAPPDNAAATESSEF